VSFTFRIQRALKVTKPTAAPHEANVRDQVGGPSRAQKGDIEIHHHRDNAPA
jgi:hypothetical protein